MRQKQFPSFDFLFMEISRNEKLLLVNGQATDFETKHKEIYRCLGQILIYGDP